jgi:hypothetical protein
VIVGDARRDSSRLYGSGRLRADTGFRYDSLAAEPASSAHHPANRARQAATSIEWTRWHSRIPCTNNRRIHCDVTPRTWRPRSERSAWPPSRDNSMRPSR